MIFDLLNPDLQRDIKLGIQNTLNLLEREGVLEIGDTQQLVIVCGYGDNMSYLDPREFLDDLTLYNQLGEGSWLLVGISPTLNTKYESIKENNLKFITAYLTAFQYLSINILFNEDKLKALDKEIDQCLEDLKVQNDTIKKLVDADVDKLKEASQFNILEKKQGREYEKTLQTIVKKLKRDPFYRPVTSQIENSTNKFASLKGKRDRLTTERELLISGTKNLVQAKDSIGKSGAIPIESEFCKEFIGSPEHLVQLNANDFYQNPLGIKVLDEINDVLAHVPLDSYSEAVIQCFEKVTPMENIVFVLNLITKDTLKNNNLATYPYSKEDFLI